MSIKKLSFPIFITVAAFLGIFSVRPSVLSIMEKLKERNDKMAELSAVESTKANLEELSSSLPSISESAEGKAVYAYLPDSTDQERIVDTVNYYAMQSGVSLGSTSVTDDVMQSDVAADGATSAAVSMDPPSPQLLSFTFAAEMTGPYQAMKAFLGSMSNPSRAHELLGFSLEKRKGGNLDEAGNTLPDSDVLSGKIKMRFYYLPERRYPRGYLLPVFQSSGFELSPVRDLLSNEKQVPELPKPSGYGRENPFVL
ncbi:MAG: hypothetical protein HGB18_05480 [Candidatus Moranbacteria bacterium]|nr:hypothetical protein [Candidatus Moranbacteria bacterium]